MGLMLFLDSGKSIEGMARSYSSVADLIPWSYFFWKSAGFGSSTGTPFASHVPAAHRRARNAGVACTMTW